MPRRMAACFMSWAILGKCSLISMPGASVLTGLNSPAPLDSGLRSKVSLWLGPPAIHSRMHDLVFLPWAAAARASTGRKPEDEAAETPAAVSCLMSRRAGPPSRFMVPCPRRVGQWAGECCSSPPPPSWERAGGEGEAETPSPPDPLSHEGRGGQD